MNRTPVPSKDGAPAPKIKPSRVARKPGRATLALFGGEKTRTKPFPTWPIFAVEEEQALLRALRSGKWGKLNGEEVARFEQRFAAMHGCKHGIGVVNGTVSLRVALMAAGVQAEDEVIVPPYTFLATATAVVEANAVPVFADIDLETFNLSPAAVEAAITPRTRAIIPVHMAGLPADMDALMAIARKHKLTVIEDAAHAHGAQYRGKPAGSIGDMGSFSFQSTKNLTSGEGGIITASNEELAEACRSIHNCGRIAGGLWYEHHVISGNYRLGEFQGAVLNAQLDRLEGQTRTRDANGKHLAARLANIPGIHPQRRTADCTRHSYHLFLLRIDAGEFGAPRQALLKALEAEGIPICGGYALPLYRQPLFLNKSFGPYLPQAATRLDYSKVRCPNCEKICSEQGAWLEQSLFLGSQSDMDDIARAFEKVYANREELDRQAWLSAAG
ncbi:MAG TPA: DegT/DnrJ/EryC1/StrS family aminotransferase [Candidatus Acidoferrum sp.]|nr:DegT/DnrJ/EryC1/StrS family aminotransferase [Candidatus Acidoferrum sp.]